MALWQLILTELRQFWREPGTLFWTFVFPLGLAGALGLGLNHRPKPTYVVGFSTKQKPFFLFSEQPNASRIIFKAMNRDAALHALQKGEVLIFAETDSSGKLTFSFDPANSEAQQAFLILENSMLKQQHKTSWQVAPLTTQGYRYIDFFIPGLLAMSIMNSCLWGIGWALVEYRMKKLLRRMAASPMRKSDFLLAQMITRFILLVLELGLLIAFAYGVFQVKLQGSWFAFVWLTIAGTWAFSGMAFLMSSRTAKTTIANGLINAITLPMTLVSGIFFQYQGFPEPLVAVIKWLPLTLLADNLRGIFNEGYQMSHILLPSGVLFGMGSLLFVCAMRIYKWQ